jgi:hypothetical protein
MSSITKIFFLAIFFAVIDTFSFFFNPSPVKIERFLPDGAGRASKKTSPADGNGLLMSLLALLF